MSKRFLPFQFHRDHQIQCEFPDGGGCDISWTTTLGGIIPGIRAAVKAVTICQIMCWDGYMAMGLAYCSSSDRFDLEEALHRSFKQAVSGPHGDPAVLRRIGRKFTKAEQHALREAMWKQRNPEGWEKVVAETNPNIQYAPTGVLVGEQGKANVREEDQGF